MIWIFRNQNFNQCLQKYATFSVKNFLSKFLISEFIYIYHEQNAYVLVFQDQKVQIFFSNKYVIAIKFF